MLSDTSYDRLAKHLLDHYEEPSAAGVWHLDLITRNRLSGGSMFDVKARTYPPLIADVAFELARRVPYDPKP